MSLFNIIDRRHNEYNPVCDVVFEVFSDDWTIYGFQPDVEDFTEWVENTSVYGATMYAMRFQGCVSMYLYNSKIIRQDHGLLVVIHPKLKIKPMDVGGYDPKLLRRI